MNIASIIVWIIVGGIAGWLANTVFRSRQNWLASVALGIAGGFAGGFILSFVGIAGTGANLINILGTFIGAVILHMVYRLVRKPTSAALTVRSDNAPQSEPIRATSSASATPETPKRPFARFQQANEPAKKRTIFISYRRSDSQDVAGRIYDRLVNDFGSECVFKDVDAIRPGADFRNAINEFLNQCDVVLVLMGTTWLDAHDQHGNKRLDDPEDFVRIEIETALSRNILVVPVLLHNAGMPAQNSLPPSLHPLLFRNAVVVRPDPDFHRDMDRLINALY